MGRIVEQVGPRKFRSEEQTTGGLVVVEATVIPSPSHFEADATTAEVLPLSAPAVKQQRLRLEAPQRDVRAVLTQVTNNGTTTTLTHIMGDHPTHGQVIGGLVEAGADATTAGRLAQQGVSLPLAPGVRIKSRVHGHSDPDQTLVLVMPSQPIAAGSQQERLLQQWANSPVAGATAEALAEIAAGIGNYPAGRGSVSVRLKTNR